MRGEYCEHYDERRIYATGDVVEVWRAGIAGDCANRVATGIVDTFRAVLAAKAWVDAVGSCVGRGDGGGVFFVWRVVGRLQNCGRGEGSGANHATRAGSRRVGCDGGVHGGECGIFVPGAAGKSNFGRDVRGTSGRSFIWACGWKFFGGDCGGVCAWEPGSVYDGGAARVLRDGKRWIVLEGNGAAAPAVWDARVCDWIAGSDCCVVGDRRQFSADHFVFHFCGGAVFGAGGWRAVRIAEKKRWRRNGDDGFGLSCDAGDFHFAGCGASNAPGGT